MLARSRFTPPSVKIRTNLAQSPIVMCIVPAAEYTAGLSLKGSEGSAGGPARRPKLPSRNLAGWPRSHRAAETDRLDAEGCQYMGVQRLLECRSGQAVDGRSDHDDPQVRVTELAGSIRWIAQSLPGGVGALVSQGSGVVPSLSHLVRAQVRLEPGPAPEHRIDGLRWPVGMHVAGEVCEGLLQRHVPLRAAELHQAAPQRCGEGLGARTDVPSIRYQREIWAAPPPDTDHIFLDITVRANHRRSHRRNTVSLRKPSEYLIHTDSGQRSLPAT